jgi:hypothetical protein
MDRSTRFPCTPGPERFSDELRTRPAKETPPDPPFARGGVRRSPRPRTASPPYDGGVGEGRRTGSRRHATSALAALAALILATVAVRADERSEVTLVRAGGQLEIRLGKAPLATYVFRDETVLRPFFTHVYAPGAVPVTRRFPPVEGTDPTDHATMHPGLWLAFGDINGVDFWRNTGRVEHERFVEPPSGGPGRGSFVVRNRYVARPGEAPVCFETCRVTILARPAGTLITIDSELASDTHELAFGAQEEIGLGVRLATPMAVKQGGRLFNSDGLTGERQAWGKHADWCAATGVIDERSAGVSLMPDPATFGSGWFHVRDYGLMVANPIERSAHKKGEPAKLIVARGKPLRLRFGVLLYAHPDTGGTDVKEAYQDFLRVLPALRGPTAP